MHTTFRAVLALMSLLCIANGLHSQELYLYLDPPAYYENEDETWGIIDYADWEHSYEFAFYYDMMQTLYLGDTPSHFLDVVSSTTGAYVFGTAVPSQSYYVR